MPFAKTCQKLISLFNRPAARQSPPLRATNLVVVEDKLLRCNWEPIRDEDGQLRYEWVSSRRH
jgi:hypothetical protein